MIDLKQLESMDMTERSTFREISESVEEAIKFLEWQGAFELMKVIETKLRYVSPQDLGPLATEYDLLLVKLKFVAFGDLSGNEASRIIQQNAADIFSTSLDLEEQLQRHVVSLPLHERDDFKKKIRDALIKNNQRLTKKTLQIGADNRPETPTVGNWIRDYTFHMGSDIVDPVQQAQYFSRNPNFSALDEEDKHRVRSILSIFERYKYPSTSVEGYDGVIVARVNNRYFVVSDGTITPVASATGPTPRPIGGKIPAGRPKKEHQSLPEFRQLIKQVNEAHTNDDEARYTAQEEMIARFGTDISALMTNFKDALVTGDVLRVIVALEVLARFGAVAEPLKSKTVRDRLLEEFLRPLADEFRVPIQNVRPQLERRPDRPGFVAAFLHWILHQALNRDLAESARIGNQIENTIASLGNTDLSGLTYFDVRHAQYRWAPLRVKPDGLVEWAE